MAEKKGIMDWQFDEIYAYCKERGELKWLKKTGEKMVNVEVYPRKKVVKLDKTTGEPARNERGEILYTTIADKSQKPKIEQRRISFVQIKTEFLEKFNLMPPKKQKARTMYDILDAIDA